jgi:hypothetical protein
MTGQPTNRNAKNQERIIFPIGIAGEKLNPARKSKPKPAPIVFALLGDWSVSGKVENQRW